MRNFDQHLSRDGMTESRGRGAETGGSHREHEEATGPRGRM
jgi:hypothetical protein